MSLIDEEIEQCEKDIEKLIEKLTDLKKQKKDADVSNPKHGDLFIIRSNEHPYFLFRYLHQQTHWLVTWNGPPLSSVDDCTCYSDGAVQKYLIDGTWKIVGNIFDVLSRSSKLQDTEFVINQEERPKI
jgi:hypothetical protein